MTPDQGLAQVLEIMVKARALLAEPDPNDDDDDEVTGAEYKAVVE